MKGKSPSTPNHRVPFHTSLDYHGGLEGDSNGGDDAVVTPLVTFGPEEQLDGKDRRRRDVQRVALT